MKVLFISGEVWSTKNPEGIVSRKLLSGLVKNGVEVTVITTRSFEFEHDINQVIFDSQENELTSKIKKRVIGIERKGFVDSVLDGIRSESIDLDYYDLLFTRSEPFYLHKIGVYVKTCDYKIKWVASFGDPVYCNPYNAGFFKKICIKNMESKVWLLADLITHTNIHAINEYKDNGFNVDRNYLVLPNPFSIPLNLLKYKAVSDDKRVGGMLTLAYVGSLYGKRKLEPLLKFINQHHLNVHLELIGAVRNVYYESRFGFLSQFLFRKDMKAINEQIERYALKDRVKYIPFMEQKALDDYIVNNVDVLVNIDASIPGNNVFLSSKIVDYLKYKKPILNISTPGATVDFLKSVGVDYYIDIYGNNNNLPSLDRLIPKFSLISKYEEYEVIKNMLEVLYGDYRPTHLQAE